MTEIRRNLSHGAFHVPGSARRSETMGYERGTTMAANYGRLRLAGALALALCATLAAPAGAQFGDIGGAIGRYEKYKSDKMIYVVGSSQDLHLSQLFKILELMGFSWAKNLLHINYGLVQGMSTRKGTAVFLNHIIDEAGNVMHQ